MFLKKSVSGLRKQGRKTHFHDAKIVNNDVITSNKNG